jgi:hypothetical protein
LRRLTGEKIKKSRLGKKKEITMVLIADIAAAGKSNRH